MKRYLFTVLALIGGVSALGARAALPASAETELVSSCKAAYSCDCESGTETYSFNATKRLPIASMCKIMTLLLTYEAVGRGELSYDEQICVSENASGMGGSQVFLDTGLSYRADELIKSVTVCSANDSCVALAERLAGSESVFVDRMNARARELGAENTLFSNCTGLPKEPQYSCAKDVSLMLRELLKHDKYYEYSAIRLENFAHPDGRETQMTNTNKLIRSYTGCDGGKTGYTAEAGFCLAATAKRGDTRAVSVVIGASDSKTRFSNVAQMFDYTFANFERKEILSKEQTETVSVRGSAVREIPVYPKNTLSVFRKKGTENEISVSYELPESVKAPVKKGDEIGSATLFVDGVAAGTTQLLAGADADKLSWWGAYRGGARDWNRV